MANRKLILSDINKFGMLFQVEPLISLDMEPSQIKAELKVAHMKLNEVMEKWWDNTYDFMEECRIHSEDKK